MLIAQFLTGAELAAGLEISARVPGCSADYADSERSNRIKQQHATATKGKSEDVGVPEASWKEVLFLYYDLFHFHSPYLSRFDPLAQIGCAVGGASMDLHCTT